jgi:hypothetical protein
MDLNNIFVFDTDFDVSVVSKEQLEWTELENVLWKTSVPFYLPNGSDWAEWTPRWCAEITNLVNSKFLEINPNSSIELYQMFIHDMPKDVSTTRTIHRDWPMINTWAAVVMLKGAGGLNFYDKFDNNTQVHAVDFKPGRILIFPSIYWHRVDSVPENRLSIGMLYYSNNLVKSMADVLPLCTCKLSKDRLICDGSHYKIAF